MDWNTYWTLIGQFLIFLVITAIPMGLWGLIVSAGFRKGRGQ